MALTEKKELYELLIRFKDGAVRGMHAVYVNKIFKDSVCVSEKQEYAQKVAVLDGDTAGLDLVQEIIPALNVAQQKAIDDRDATITQKDADLADRDNTIQEKLTEIDQKLNTIAARDQTINDKNTELSEKNTLISQKDAAIAQKDADIAAKAKAITDKDAEIASLKS